MLSIVVVTHNSRQHIKACLSSIFSQGVNDVQIIVVDNASADGTRELIKADFNQLALIENSRNLGASQARNQGIGQATGEWVLTLDSDVVLGDGFLKGFLAVRDQLCDDVGMVQPCILNMDGKTICSQGIFLSPLRRFYDLNKGKNKDAVGPVSRKIIGPCAAAAFYRRIMLNQLKEGTGYFDERFFFLVEDVDLAWRAKRAGWKVRSCPEMVCRHAGNGSCIDRDVRQYLNFRNRHLMISKNESFWGKIWVYLISMPYELARMIHLFLVNKYFLKRRSEFF
jgi:GT2 family glycosyltransferase